MKTKTILLTAALLSVATLAAPAADIDVSALWDKHCTSCHAKDGSGKTTMGRKAGAKDYRDPKVQAEIQDDKAIKAIAEGITEKGKEVMKPYKDKLSDEEIKALLVHLKSFVKK